MGSQKCASCELWYGNLFLKMLVEISLLAFFWFCICKPDHALMSQRSQEKGKSAKIFVHSCRRLLGGEVHDCSDVSSTELCSFGSSVYSCLRPHAWLHSSAEPLCLSSAFWEGGCGLQKENEHTGWICYTSGCGTENILRNIAVSKEKNISVLCWNSKCVWGGGFSDVETDCARGLLSHCTRGKGLWWHNLPFQNLPWKN